MENNPDKTWSRSTACPARRLVHSESGNCGPLKELTSDDLANLMSREKFSRANWVTVCLRDGDKACDKVFGVDDITCAPTMFLFAGWVSSSGDLDHLDILSTPSSCSSLPPTPSLLCGSSRSSTVWDLSPALLQYLSKLSNTSQ